MVGTTNTEIWEILENHRGDFDQFLAANVRRYFADDPDAVAED